MRKFFTLLVSAAMLSTMTAYAQKSQYDSIVAKETLGNSDAAFELYELARDGKLYENANENQSAVQRYLNRAADLGSVPARFLIAKSYLSGKATLQAGQKIAFEYLMKLSTESISDDFTKADFFEANYLLGECYERGRGINPNISNAVSYYLFASLYNEDARMALARIFLKSTDTSKFKANMNIAMLEFFGVYMLNKNRLDEIVQYLRATSHVDDFSKFLEEKADAGDGLAAYFLAESTFTGTIFPKEVTKSLKYYHEAVKCGRLEAALKLGDIYTYGTNFVPVDQVQAMKLYERAIYSKDEKVRTDSGKRLIEGVEKKAKEDKKEADPHVIFKYLMLSHNYEAARELIRKQDLSWSAQDIYLKAKEFEQRVKSNDRAGQAEYRDRLRMASNAGYFLAVQDYYKEFRSREYARMIQALEADPLPEDPDWLYLLSVCYRSGGTANKLRDFKKSLKYMQQAAELGHVASMDLLVRLYSAGAAQYGVAEPQPDLVKKYTDMILHYDAEMRYPDYFTDYLKKLESGEGEFSKEFLAPAIRSVEFSPLAAMTLAHMYMKGNEAFQIKKDEMFAFVLMHVAAMNGYRPAFDEIVKIYTYGINDVVDASKSFANKYVAVAELLGQKNENAEHRERVGGREGQPRGREGQSRGRDDQPRNREGQRGGMPGGPAMMPGPAVQPGGMPGGPAMMPGPAVQPGGMPGGPAMMPGPAVQRGGMPGGPAMMPGPAVQPGGMPGQSAAPITK